MVDSIPGMLFGGSNWNSLSATAVCAVFNLLVSVVATPAVGTKDTCIGLLPVGAGRRVCNTPDVDEDDDDDEDEDPDALSVVVGTAEVDVEAVSKFKRADDIGTGAFL